MTEKNNRTKQPVNLPEKTTERIYHLENADLRAFYGENNAHMRTLKSLFPKVQFKAQGNILKVIGDKDETELFLQKVKLIENYCDRFNYIDEEIIREIVAGTAQFQKPGMDNLIIYGVNGKPITARNPRQESFVQAFEKNDLIFALGPAGSGKTYVAIALAVRALKNKEIKKIILSRPAVEAGEKLGFLPGEMKDKLDPYLQPLYDALQDMIPAVKLRKYMEDNVIQIAPLAYMRGRTLSDAVIILDEAQNATKRQIKMFLTRLGMGAKMILTGDVTQVDLPPMTTSGLIHALEVLNRVPGIARIEFRKMDIVRHRLVQKIVDAYEKKEKIEKGEK